MKGSFILTFSNIRFFFLPMTNIIGTVGILKLSIICSVSNSSTRIMLVFPKPPSQICIMSYLQ